MKSTVIETILRLFNVSRKEAELYATEFIDLVESKGGGANSSSVIETQVPKVFGNRLEWRNEKVKQKQERKKIITENSYNSHIKGKKRKW